MTNRIRTALFVTLSLCVALALGTSLAVGQDATQGSKKAKESAKKQGSGKKNNKYTDRFPEEEFLTTGENPYFKLEPGYVLKLQGKEDGEKIDLTITVTEETEEVDGVLTRVVEEREEKDGRLYEISRNFFVIGEQTNSVYYFGEDVDFYNEKGEVINHKGSWRSGVEGARYGLQMPGIVLTGSRYYQEVAPKIALDRAEHASMNEDLKTPAGKFENVLKVRETTPLEPDVSIKFHAEGVGLIADGDVRLTCSGSAGTC